MGKDVKGIRDEGIDQPVTGSRGHCFGKCMYFYKKTNKKKTNKQTTFTWKCYSRKANSSSSVGATARCGLWPVEQYLCIFPYPSPTLSIFSLPALENLFLRSTYTQYFKSWKSPCNYQNIYLVLFRPSSLTLILLTWRKW